MCIISEQREYSTCFLHQVYHAMDVTLCTSSILHLSCIALDRYCAIVNKPLLYQTRVTLPRVILAISICWLLSGLTGFVPVFTGLYSSQEHLDFARTNPHVCDLVVNKYFSVIAGCISFWLPGSIMVFVYCMVYRETKKLNKSLTSSKATLVTAYNSGTYITSTVHWLDGNFVYSINTHFFTHQALMAYEWSLILVIGLIRHISTFRRKKTTKNFSKNENVLLLTHCA